MRYRPIFERFSEKYTVDPSTQCWNWTGSVSRNYGYIGGQTGADGKRSENLPAHRFSYMHYRGEIPAGMKVLHRCNNPRCVNPDHLKLGTHTDNMEDMRRAGTRVGRNAGTTFSDQQLKKIERLLSRGATQQHVADVMGIARSTVQRTVKKGLLLAPKTARPRLSQQQRSKITALLNQGVPILQVAQKFGVDRRTIRKIRDAKSPA